MKPLKYLLQNNNNKYSNSKYKTFILYTHVNDYNNITNINNSNKGFDIALV